MAVVAPDKLSLDAVVPHSLDNQFIPDVLLRQMVRTRQDFNSSRIRERRSRLGERN
jgi:hypothetical protein